MSKRNYPGRPLIMAALLLALGSLASGCLVEVTDDDLLFDPIFVADMRVHWTIDGADDPAWCDDLGIETWVVEARGPEYRELELSCRSDYWDSGSAFYSLEEGDYRVVVRAMDMDGYEITSAGSRLGEVIDDGGVDVLTVRFNEIDF